MEAIRDIEHDVILIASCLTRPELYRRLIGPGVDQAAVRNSLG